MEPALSGPKGELPKLQLPWRNPSRLRCLAMNQPDRNPLTKLTGRSTVLAGVTQSDDRYHHLW